MILVLLAVVLTVFGGVASAATPTATVQNDVFWKDTAGNPIYSQGGGMIKVGGTYYWYGAKYNGAVSYYNNLPAGKPATPPSAPSPSTRPPTSRTGSSRATR